MVSFTVCFYDGFSKLPHVRYKPYQRTAWLHIYNLLSVLDYAKATLILISRLEIYRLLPRTSPPATPTGPSMKSRVASRRALQAASTFAVVTTGSITLYAFKTTAGPPTTRAPLDAPSTPVPPKFPRIKSREEQVEALRRSGRTNTSTADPQAAENASLDGIYDLLIIGGGATGTGIALDAVTRGLKVALVERDDFSSGTSSKSTKLVHGGVRYLEKAVKGFDYEQFNLVRSALKERKYFLDIAPHLSCSLPLLVPIRRWWELPYMWAGAKLYDLLAGSERLQKSYFISRQRAFEYFPMLDNNRLLGALIYYDGQHNDSRTNVSLAVTAALYGATVLNYVEVTGLERDAQGKLCGARVCDLIPGPRPTLDAKGKGFVVRARGIINATGPFADELLRQDKKDCKEVVAPSSGVHVVLPEWLGPKNMGLVDPSSDGRVVFLLPWQGKIIAGTTDNACAVEKNPLPRDQDINWVLNEIQGLFCPGMEPQRSDVLASWAGTLLRHFPRSGEASIFSNIHPSINFQASDRWPVTSTPKTPKSSRAAISSPSPSRAY